MSTWDVPVAPGVSSTIVAYRSPYRYGRENFRHRYDGAVDLQTGTVALHVGCAWVPAAPEWFDRWGKLTHWGMNDFLKFQMEFQQVIERSWSYRFSLRPAFPVAGRLLYRARVFLWTAHEDPHVTITVLSGGARGRSCAFGPDEHRQMELQEGDNAYGQMDWRGHTMTRCTSVHEFGHHLGLEHPLPKKEDPHCYGDTYEQAQTVMGCGDIFEPKHYEPFLQVARRFGQDVLPADVRERGNVWEAVFNHE